MSADPDPLPVIPCSEEANLNDFNDLVLISFAAPA